MKTGQLLIEVILHEKGNRKAACAGGRADAGVGGSRQFSVAPWQWFQGRLWRFVRNSHGASRNKNAFICRGCHRGDEEPSSGRHSCCFPHGGYAFVRLCPTVFSLGGICDMDSGDPVALYSYSLFHKEVCFFASI